MTVIHFQRKPFPGSFSLESHFACVREELARCGVTVCHSELPHFSKGLLPRVRNMAWARRHQGAVNHITGDVHFLAAALLREKTILTICDLTILDYYRGVRRQLLKWLWYDWPLRHAAIVTVISATTRQALIKQCRVTDPEKIVVIPVSVSSRFEPSEKSFCSDCPRILQIGTKRQKNIERLCEALEGLRCHLHIIGQLTVEQRAALKRYRIEFTSQQNLSEAELYQAYCDSDLVSFVSTAEGFGMPIIEAQCVERPVLTGNCSSMPEVAGDGACLVDPFDVKAMRTGLLRVISDSDYRDQLVRAGRINRRRFSLTSVTAQYAALYRQIDSSVPRLSDPAR